MNKCVIELTEVLFSMSYYNWNHPHIPGPHWTDRPECLQVLAKYNEWSINKNYLKTDSTFDSTLKLIQQNDNKFFAQYLYEKLGPKILSSHNFRGLCIIL